MKTMKRMKHNSDNDIFYLIGFRKKKIQKMQKILFIWEQLCCKAPYDEEIYQQTEAKIKRMLEKHGIWRSTRR